MTFTELANGLGLTVNHDNGYYVTFDDYREAEVFVALAHDCNVKIYADFIRDSKTNKYFIYERRY